MKFKRFIASKLIFILVISSMGFYCVGFSQNQHSFENSQSSIATQLVADTQDPSHDFREGFKTNHTPQFNSVSLSFLQAASQWKFGIVRYSQYADYLRKQRLQTPSSKLFIDFGALII